VPEAGPLRSCKDCRSHHPYHGGDDVLFWPEWNHQPLCQTHHNQKTTQQDPITKANRKAGMYSEQEERAAQRNNWMYEVDHE
jgi:5-methylcytosine-specific restriction endonuclease McrA